MAAINPMLGFNEVEIPAKTLGLDPHLRAPVVSRLDEADSFQESGQ